MPTLQVTTKKAEEVWKSPDGQKVIYKLVLDYNGQEVQAKTYSRTIARENWSGTVETYEKQGRSGSETFVKQPQQTGSFQGGSRSAGSASASRPQDNFTMFLSYAKDVAVAMLEKGTLDQAKYGEVLDAILVGGNTLYEGRPDAPKPSISPEKSELDSVFGEKESVTTEEDTPWNPSEEPPQLPVS